MLPLISLDHCYHAYTTHKPQGAAEEGYNEAIINALGLERRNEVLSRLYIARYVRKYAARTAVRCMAVRRCAAQCMWLRQLCVLPCPIPPPVPAGCRTYTPMRLPAL